MREELINLTKKLISINTDPKNKEELKEAINLVKQTLREFKYKSFLKNGYPSLLFYNKPASKFKIILNGHLDIIPGKKEQLQPIIRDDKLYGLGALDMKGGLATLILVFKEIAKKVNYPLALQVVTDEEIGGFYGTKYQIKKGVRADFVIVGEPTNLNIKNEARGIIWVELITEGQSAHGAYVWKGKNAIWEMINILIKLKNSFSIPQTEKWITTLNLANVSTSNTSFNKIPDNCVAWLDIRYTLSDKEKILEKLKKIIKYKANLKIHFNEPAHYTSPKNPYLQKLRITACNLLNREIKILRAFGSSDLRHYDKIRVNGVAFGPEGQGMAERKEWVSIDSLEKYFLILKNFLMNL
jgi:succinyl-diaminopimelate desuccinylase